MSDTFASSLFLPLTLPNGAVLPNRIAKAAMEENLAAPGQVPSSAHRALYDAWARGGAGLIVTGNVMVAADHVTSPHGIILDSAQPLAPFREWAQSVTAQGASIWMQINHPGRLVRADLSVTPLAPSGIRVETATGLWARPREMSEADISHAMDQFVSTAELAVEAGFSGVQVHGAHGYLISQFLSPLSNTREDRWGGSIENRSRFLIEVVQRVRESIAPYVALGVKLNSADFQRGGFDKEDATYVVDALRGRGIDLLELSGGNVEAPAMHARIAKSSQEREAYFLDFVRELTAVADMPVMLTGGIRSRAGAEDVRSAGIDMVGIGSALAVEPALPNKWLGEDCSIAVPEPDDSAPPPQRSALKQALIRAHLRHHAGTDRRAPTDLVEAVEYDHARRASQIPLYSAWLATRDPQ